MLWATFYSCVALLLLLGEFVKSSDPTKDDVLIGWKGESFKPSEVWPRDTETTERITEEASSDTWMEVVSWKPRAFIIHNFLTDEECDYIRRLARPLMRRSTVVGANGASVQDPIRTSYGAFLRRLSDPAVVQLEEKLATITRLNVSHQEDVQILRYGVGQKYGAHYDSLVDQSPRIVTVLVYLSDDCDGCETAFPKDSEWVDPMLAEKYGPWSACAEGHVAHRPKKGSALMFYSLTPSGEQDPASMHTGCPVTRGVKWTATIWIHTNPFHPEWLANKPEAPDTHDPGLCEDFHAACKSWAASGECDKNPGFMKGDGYNLGGCRLSCKLCEPCGAQDALCRRRNREAAGFLPIEDED